MGACSGGSCRSLGTVVPGAAQVLSARSSSAPHLHEGKKISTSCCFVQRKTKIRIVQFYDESESVVFIFNLPCLIYVLGNKDKGNNQLRVLVVLFLFNKQKAEEKRENLLSP